MTTEQYSIGYDEGYQDGWNAAMEAKPAQPQQEPVAQWQKRHPHHWEGKWENTNEHDAKWWRDNSQGWEIRPLYTSPPARKPLREEEMEKIAAEYWLYPRKFVRAIEAAHGIKGDA